MFSQCAALREHDLWNLLAACLPAAAPRENMPRAAASVKIKTPDPFTRPPTPLLVPMSKTTQDDETFEEERPSELHTQLCLAAWMLGGALQGVVAGLLMLGLLIGLCEILPFCRDYIADWFVLGVCLLAFVVGFVLFGYELQALDRALSKRRRRRAAVRSEMPKDCAGSASVDNPREGEANAT